VAVALSAVVSVPALALSGCGGSSTSAQSTTTTGAPAAGGATVDIRNLAFMPRTVTIQAGESVTWKFEDSSIPHNVNGAGWHSSDRSSGTYSRTFAAPGTYAYRCTIHPFMTGQVVVNR
jgi:plastocyanin